MPQEAQWHCVQTNENITGTARNEKPERTILLIYDITAEPSEIMPFTESRYIIHENINAAAMKNQKS